MKTIMILVICLITSNLYGQDLDKNDLNKYFFIDGQLNEFEGKTYKNIYPVIKKDAIDSIGFFMYKNRRRFNYILKNKTNKIYEDSVFQNLFPDTIKMSAIYCQEVGQDTIVLDYLNSFLNPNKFLEKKLSYSESELMKVASRFFLCDRVNPDTTINWHVCIGLNGQKEAGWTRDFTLLEAFCFEAIFYGLRSEKEEETQFMNSFMNYLKEAEMEYKDLPFELILEKAKSQIFEKMENDSALQTLLLVYYSKKKNQLPFRFERAIHKAIRAQGYR